MPRWHFCGRVSAGRFPRGRYYSTSWGSTSHITIKHCAQRKTTAHFPRPERAHTSNFHEFSLDLMKIPIFERGNLYVVVVPVSWKREPPCGSGSRFPGTETIKWLVYLIVFSIPFLTVPRGTPGSKTLILSIFGPRNLLGTIPRTISDRMVRVSSIFVGSRAVSGQNKVPRALSTVFVVNEGGA